MFWGKRDDIRESRQIAASLLERLKKALQLPGQAIKEFGGNARAFARLEELPIGAQGEGLVQGNTQHRIGRFQVFACCTEYFVFFGGKTSDPVFTH